MSVDQLYIETLLEEAKDPQNVGFLENPDYSHSEVNASCGDRVAVDLKFDKSGAVVAVAWQGEGCVISQAAMSVLSEEIKGKTLEEIHQLGEEEMLAFLGLDKIVMGRKKCLMLGLKAIT